MLESAGAVAAGSGIALTGLLLFTAALRFLAGGVGDVLLLCSLVLVLLLLLAMLSVLMCETPASEMVCGVMLEVSEEATGCDAASKRAIKSAFNPPTGRRCWDRAAFRSTTC